MGLLFAINSIQAIGDMTATTSGSMDRLPSEDELRGGILGYGFTNIIGALLGGLPTATFSQNVGIVTTTKVVNRCVLGLAAILILISGFVPKISAILTTIPQAVLGGATISVFASIAMTGMRLINTEEMNYRATSIVGLSVALGNGNFSGTGGTSNISRVGNDNFWKEPCCCDNRQCHYLEYYFAKGKEGEAIG